MKKILSILLTLSIVGLSSINCNAMELRNPVNTVSIVMVGDDLIHQPLYKAASNGNDAYDFSTQYKHVPELKQADIAIINQETILVENYDKISSYPCFGTPAEIADDLVNAGFDIIASATNHSYDKGYSGIEETLDYWNNKYPNIPVLGIHNSSNDKDYYLYKYNDLTIGFVNYTYGLNGITRTKDYAVDLLSDEDVEDTMFLCSAGSDIQVAILHVGEEYQYTPTEYHKKQVDRFIDLGADVVICAHPHVVEPYEKITTENGNTGIVYYSLGNFISGQTEISRCLGGMAEFNICYSVEDGVVNAYVADDFRMIPLFTHQQSGYYSTFRLQDYNDDMLKKHKLYGKVNGTSVSDIWNLWDSIIKKDGD